MSNKFKFHVIIFKLDIKSRCIEGVYVLPVQTLLQSPSALPDVSNFFRLSLDLLAIADNRGYFVEVNSRWQDVLGYVPKDLCAKPFLDFVHPDDVPATLAEMRKLRQADQVPAYQAPADQHFAFENRYRCCDGSYRWLSWRGQVSGEYTYAIARDITDQKQAELTLKASEQRNRALLQALPQIMFTLDRQGYYRNVQGQYQPYLKDAAALIGKHLSEVVPEHAASIQASIAQTLTTGVPTRSHYELADAADGTAEAHIFDAHIVKLDDEQVLMVAEDNSAKHHNQRRLSEVNTRLEHLNTISRELNAATDSDALLWRLLERFDRDGVEARLMYVDPDENPDKDTDKSPDENLDEDISEPTWATIVNHVSRRNYDTQASGTRFKLADFPLVRAIFDQPNRALMIENIAEADIDDASKQAHAFFADKAVVYFPLLQQGDVIGIVVLAWLEPQTFTSAERELCHALTSVFTPLVRNIRLLDELENQVAERTQALREREALFAGFLHYTPGLMWVKDRQHRYVRVNQHFADSLGVPREQMLGKRDADFLPLAYAQGFAEVESQVFAERQAVILNEELPVADETRCLLTTRFPIFDGSGALYALGGMSVDVTERKRAEEQAQAYQDALTRAHAEVDIARRIQALLVPKAAELAAINALDIAGSMQPAEQVGGDYYDVLPVGDSLKLAIGDVTGHGLESGLLMLMAQTATRALVESGEQDPRVILAVLNRTLFANLARMGGSKSMTMALMDYQQADTGGTLCLSGQHEHLLLVAADGTVTAQDTLELGLPLGLEADISRFMANETLTLEPGGGVVLYTDGITEAENERGDMYGLARLQQVITQVWHQPAQGVLEAVLEDVYGFIGERDVLDDITALVVKQR
jgi:PAS domain S-box-containing protein